MCTFRGGRDGPFGKVVVFDSLDRCRTAERDLSKALFTLYGGGEYSIHFLYMVLQKQIGGADCGLFVLAYAAELASMEAKGEREIYAIQKSISRDTFARL